MVSSRSILHRETQKCRVTVNTLQIPVRSGAENVLGSGTLPARWANPRPNHPGSRSPLRSSGAGTCRTRSRSLSPEKECSKRVGQGGHRPTCRPRAMVTTECDGGPPHERAPVMERKGWARRTADTHLLYPLRIYSLSFCHSGISSHVSVLLRCAVARDLPPPSTAVTAIVGRPLRSPTLFACSQPDRRQPTSATCPISLANERLHAPAPDATSRKCRENELDITTNEHSIDWRRNGHIPGSARAVSCEAYSEEEMVVRGQDETSVTVSKQGRVVVTELSSGSRTHQRQCTPQRITPLFWTHSMGLGA